MRAGRSSSEHRRAAILLACLVAAARSLDPRDAPSAAGDPPAAAAPAGAAPGETPRRTCPRCGYACEAGWAFCGACGWDLRTLTGQAAEERLVALTRSAVGVVIIKRSKGLKEFFTPRDYKRFSRYITNPPGQRKHFGTAFPFLKPGLFVTQARLLEDAEEAHVRTHDNRTYKAEVVGFDVDSGIGVLRAEVPGAAPLGAAAERPRPPETSFAVCYPVDRSEKDLVRYLPVSLHRGALTADGQTGTFLVAFEDLWRGDHTLPLGCVGAALINLRGELAGMVLGSPDDGITYGVRSDTLAPIVETLSSGAAPARPFFGIGLLRLDERRRARFRIEAAAERPVIAYVIPGSPASTAGVRPGDLLAAVAGETVSGVADAGARLLRSRPGDPPVALTVVREGAELRVEIAPAARPARILLDPIDELRETLEANLTEVGTGPTSHQGLRVTHLVRGGRGEADDYKDGDTILSVDGKGVRRLDTFNEIVRSGQKHVFEGTDAEDGPYDRYRLSLEVRTADDKRESRSYFNMFPAVLAPPVY